MNPRLRLVLFDLGGTLLRLDKPEVFWRLLAEDGAGVPFELVWHAFHRAFRFFMQRRPHMWRSGAELRDRAILNHVIRELGVTVNAETMRRALQRSDHWTLFGDTLEAVDGLRARGYRTGLITNWDSSARALLAGMGLARRLDPVVVSSEVGREKPDPGIFRLALERAGVPPAAALYVGDNYWDDVAGARAAGVGAILVDRRPDWDEVAYDCPVVASLREAVAFVERRSGAGRGPGREPAREAALA